MPHWTTRRCGAIQTLISPPAGVHPAQRRPKALSQAKRSGQRSGRGNLIAAGRFRDQSVRGSRNCRNGRVHLRRCNNRGGGSPRVPSTSAGTTARRLHASLQLAHACVLFRLLRRPVGARSGRRGSSPDRSTLLGHDDGRQPRLVGGRRPSPLCDAPAARPSQREARGPADLLGRGGHSLAAALPAARLRALADAGPEAVCAGRARFGSSHRGHRASSSGGVSPTGRPMAALRSCPPTRSGCRSASASSSG